MILIKRNNFNAEIATFKLTLEDRCSSIKRDVKESKNTSVTFANSWPLQRGKFGSIKRTNTRTTVYFTAVSYARGDTKQINPYSATKKMFTVR